MNTVNLAAEIEAWIDEDPERAALLIKKAPVAKSTLGMTLRGRYIPAPRLENAIRNVMQAHPARKRKTAAVS